MSKTYPRRRTTDATPKAQKPAASARRKLTSIPDSPAQADSSIGEMVTVTVPKKFTLTIDHHHSANYDVGTYSMPVEHAEHWWAVANGVTLA